MAFWKISPIKWEMSTPPKKKSVGEPRIVIIGIMQHAYEKEKTWKSWQQHLKTGG